MGFLTEAVVSAWQVLLSAYRQHVPSWPYKRWQVTIGGRIIAGCASLSMLDRALVFQIAQQQPL